MPIMALWPIFKTDFDTVVDTDILKPNLNVSNFDFITKGYEIDFDGVIDGFASVSGLGEHLTLFSNLDINRVFVNKQEIGDVMLKSLWNDPLKAINLNSEIYKNSLDGEKAKSVDFNGYYYTQKKTDNLDFSLNFNKFNLEIFKLFRSSAGA